MKKLAVILCLVLGGCSTIFATIQNPLNTTRLAELESTYGIARSAANAYRTLYTVNRCTKTKLESATNICARRSVVIKLQQADKQASIAMQAARDFVAANPTIDATTVITTAWQAVNYLKDVETQYGIK